MPEADEETSHEGPSDPISDHLPIWVRWIFSVLGAAGAFFGVWAIFTSDNQAGTAVLIVAAGAFLLIGLQGTPLRRFSGSEVELAIYKRRAASVAREVQRNESPEVAIAVTEALQAIDPSVGLPNPWLIYEKQVGNELRRFLRVEPMDRSGSKVVDYQVEGPSGRRINVVVKLRSGQPLSENELFNIISSVGRHAGGEGLLVVTNTLASKGARDLLTNNPPPVPTEVVTWKPGDHDGILSDAVMRIGDRIDNIR